MRIAALALITAVAVAGINCAGAPEEAETPAEPATPAMSFFITSANPGQGADFGGLEGADRHCQALAEAAGAGDQVWRAYLSATADGEQPAVNARDRIGSGPWVNALGVQVAADVDGLHSDASLLSKENSVNERGEVVSGRGDDPDPNRHDILTGSTLDGMASTTEGDTTCSNWTSDAEDGSALVGHHDRQGGGDNPTSWNAAHGSSGCSLENLRATGGDGLIYCFAVR
jgi:hypothetical protein